MTSGKILSLYRVASTGSLRLESCGIRPGQVVARPPIYGPDGTCHAYDPADDDDVTECGEPLNDFRVWPEQRWDVGVLRRCQECATATNFGSAPR